MQSIGGAMSLLLISCFAGIFFGLRYNVLALIPLTFISAITCGAVAVVHGHNFSASLFAAVIPIIGLEGGYLIGLANRDLSGKFLALLGNVQSERF
jgi:hypothetical protein